MLFANTAKAAPSSLKPETIDLGRRSPLPSLSSSEPANQIPLLQIQNSTPLTRKNFLRGSLALLGVTALSTLVSSEAKADPPPPLNDTDQPFDDDKNDFPVRIQSNPSSQKTEIQNNTDDESIHHVPSSMDMMLDNDHSPIAWIGTVIESLLVYGKGRLSNLVMQKLNIPHGNKSLDPAKMKHTLETNPMRLLLLGGVIGPIVEEMTFRFYVAKKFTGKVRGEFKFTEMVLSAGFFALVHNLKPQLRAEKMDTFPYIEKIHAGVDVYFSNPISQFILGSYAWYAMRTKGITHAMFAHGLYNSIAIGLNYREFKKSQSEASNEIDGENQK